jgi:energy-coupling factor transport system substrate-specific component
MQQLLNLKNLMLAFAALVVGYIAAQGTSPAGVGPLTIFEWLLAVFLVAWLVLSIKGISLSSITSNYTTRDYVLMAALIAVGGVAKGYWGSVVAIASAMGGPVGATLFAGWFFYMWPIIANHFVRKPLVGAITMVIGGIIEIAVGNPFGLPVLLFNAWEGLGPDLIYMATGFKRFDLPVALAAGVMSACLGLVYGWIYFGFSQLPPIAFITYVAATVVGGLIGGVAGYYTSRALEKMGVKQQAVAVIRPSTR